MQQPSPSGKTSLPDDAQFLGSDTYFVKMFLDDGTWVGIEEIHKRLVDDSWEWCAGYVPFEHLSRTGTVWQVESLDPLTLRPSLLCNTCNHHGFIRQGQWAPA
jgi:hypothetical protein